MRPALAAVFLLILAACDPAPTPVDPAAPAKRERTLAFEVRPVAPLPPDRRTHVAPTGTGQTFWVQESPDGGRETVFAAVDGGLPSATKFSNAAVLEALGNTDPAATGSIQSMVAGPRQELYFFFTGGSRRKLLAAFGTFSPSTGRTTILADTAKLTSASGMGAALALARGSLVRVGNVIWVWLRHDDGFALLSVDVSVPGAALRRPFERLGGAADAPRLTTAGEDLAAGPSGGLLYLDRATGRLWQVSALGEASVARDLSDLPKGVTAPVLDDAGRAVMLAPDGPPFNEPPDALIPRATTSPAVEYPAWVAFDGDRRFVLPRAAFDAPSRLNLRQLAPRRLVRDRSGWLGYDPLTGELLRFVVVER
jgi:hypothetical protein